MNQKLRKTVSIILFFTAILSVISGLLIMNKYVIITTLTITTTTTHGTGFEGNWGYICFLFLVLYFILLPAAMVEYIKYLNRRG